MIDAAPAESKGTGPGFTFRERERSKEIQLQAFSMFSPSKVSTFGEIKREKHIP